MAKRYYLIVLLFFGYAAIMLSKTYFNLYMPQFLRDNNFSNTQIGEIFSTYSLVYLVVIIFAGWISDKTGYRPLLLISMLCMLASVICNGLSAPEVMTVKASQCLAGVGFALFYCGCFKATARHFSTFGKSTVISLLLSAGVLGAFYSSPFLVFIHPFNWLHGFTVLAIIFFLLLAGFFLLGRLPANDTESAGEKNSYSESVLHPVILFSCLGAFFITFSKGVAIPWLPMHIMQVLNERPSAIYVIMGLSVFFSVPAFVIIGLVIGKTPLRSVPWIVTIGTVLLMLLRFYGITTDQFWLFSLTYLTSQLFESAVFLALLLLPVLFVSWRVAGLAAALSSFSYTLGLALGMMLASQSLAFTQNSTMYLYFIACVLTLLVTLPLFSLLSGAKLHNTRVQPGEEKTSSTVNLKKQEK